MANLLNDGSLIGFWPLNEPSGAPFFANHSPARSRCPSGVSFDMQVGNTNTSAAIDHQRGKSVWPGTATIFNISSGTNYSGYMAQGYWRLGTDSSPYSRYLILGQGGSRTREQTLAPNIANSGFTAGIWVYPNSNGYLNYYADTVVTYNGETQGMRAHSLFGQFLFAQTAGWHIGVSGHMDNGAQFGSVINNRQLNAYVGLERGTTAAPTILRSPIESGVPTHLTFTYRYVDGSIDQIAFYKNGRLEASGTTNANLTLSNANLLTRGLGIGNADDNAAGTNMYTGTSGWNHLVSGAYFFRRVLNEGEILSLHQAGGLQSDSSALLPTQQVAITDSKLLAHYPFRSIGFADASKNHYPLIGDQDEGDTGGQVPCPGPFKGGSVLETGSATQVLATSSGLMNAMLDGRSWTIGIQAAPMNNLGRDDNMIFSMGSVSTIATTAAPTAVSAFSFGMALTEMGASPAINRLRFSAYPLGNIVDNVYDVDIANSGFHNAVSTHYAVAYDDQTRGLAIYANGIQQHSGTIAFSLTDHLVKLAASGFPLLFGNGVQNQIADAATRGMFAAGGLNVCLGPITIMGRPLLPSEVRGLAQSGIDSSALYRTPYDPRLMGYWPCSEYKLDDVLVEDRARIWQRFPGNLVRGETTTKWNILYGTPGFNFYGTRSVPNELDSYGILGITSGIFGVHSDAPGTAAVTDADNARSSLTNLSLRYKPVNEERDLASQNLLGEYIIGYEVTPSGRIPLTELGLTSNTNKFEFNSTLHVYGNMGNGGSAALGEMRSFLTTIDAAQGSGVSLVFVARANTFSAANTIPLVSGTLPFGVPSKVLLHTKFNSPYNVTGETTGEAPILVSLWINGVRVQSRTLTATNARIWSDQIPNSASDSWVLQFGGEAGTDAVATQISRDGGLGDIYLREMFVMRGTFETDEVASLAASGIQHNDVTGYTPVQATTQVTVADAELQGYWRFNGLDGGGSGTTDLSLKFNHLSPISQLQNIHGQATVTTRSSRFFPGPLQNSDLMVRCSGVSYTGAVLAGVVHPPFAVSGAAFNRPNVGFSVGFLLAKRATVPSANTADAILSYGLLAANAGNVSTLNLNRGWTILADDENNVKMVASVGGNGYYSNDAVQAQSGQIVCGVFDGGGIFEDLRRFDSCNYGANKPPRLDLYSHYCWVFDPLTLDFICYLNGNEVDRQRTKFDVNSTFGGLSGLGPAIPATPEARMITFLNHQNATPWDFSTTALNDQNSVLTDVFYFSRALTEPEVRYIALNGIDSANGTPTSGTIGGYILGSIQSSGIIGGYQRGLGTTSGIIGGSSFGAFNSSGIIGGFVSGIFFFTDRVSGVVGGYIHGYDIGSGLIGGYIKGAGMGSGLIGGFMLGGLIGNMQFDGGFTVQAFAAKDFDSQLVVRKDTSADFDAKLVIFQAETGPLVDIIIPGSTVVATTPYNQYFIGAASGTQGKTIAMTRWTFGDLTPSVSVAESGAGIYPVQHYYSGSGLFIAKFEAIDSNGLHGSALRIIDATAGITPVHISFSGVPRSGNAALTVDFATKIEALPPGVAITATLLNFDDGQSTITFNPVHVYTEPGTFKPIWTVRDSRGVIWSDSLESGSNN